MFTKRIIPCLDVNNGRVVKGVNFVDELVFLDITASSDARATKLDMVRLVA